MEKYDIVNEVKPGGTFLLNCQWTPDELDEKLPAAVRKAIAERNIHFYIINAVKIGKEIGLGNRTNAVLQSAFFKLANIIPIDDAIHYAFCSLSCCSICPDRLLITSCTLPLMVQPAARMCPPPPKNAATLLTFTS